jgi:hypothetical protein
MPKHNKAEVQELLRQQWQRQRAKGKLRFILLWGALGWGLPFGVLYAASQAYFRHYSMLKEPVLLLAFVPILLLCGCGFGLSLWHSNEKRYKNNSSSYPDDSEFPSA